MLERLPLTNMTASLLFFMLILQPSKGIPFLPFLFISFLIPNIRPDDLYSKLIFYFLV